MRPSLSLRFIDKACAAMVAAIEIFNKPSFSYREETFALLALNAWELLLKARVLHVGGNDPRHIHVYQPRTSKTTGKPTKKLYVKRNRAGAPMTIGLGHTMNMLDKHGPSQLSPPLRANLESLVSIRDNAAHYVSASPLLAKTTLEVGTASVANFIHVSKEWFDRDFASSLSLLLPIGFIDLSEAQVVTTGRDEKKLIAYLQSLTAYEDAQSPYAVSLSLNITMSRAQQAKAGVKVAVVSKEQEPNAPSVVVSYDEKYKDFPWDYSALTKRLLAKFPGLKLNAPFHKFMNTVKANPKLCIVHFFDPINKVGSRKHLYSPNVVQAYAASLASK